MSLKIVGTNQAFGTFMEFRSSNPRGNIEFRTFLNNGLVGIFTYSRLAAAVLLCLLATATDRMFEIEEFRISVV